MIVKKTAHKLKTQCDSSIREKKNGCERVVQQDGDGETQDHKHGKNREGETHNNKKEMQTTAVPDNKEKK